MPSSRRTFLAALTPGFVGAVAGCGAPSNDRAESAQTAGHPPTTGDPDRPTDESMDVRTRTPTPAFDGGPLADLPEECVTDEFSGFTGTTPRPVPDRPTDPTPDSAVAYARAFERYYLAYRAMYDLGPQTPDGRTTAAAHAFPDVRMENLTSEAVDSGDGWVAARLAYDRVFDGEPRGAYTVNYLITADHTVRAETEGRVSPGPDPFECGRVQRC